MSHVFTGRLKEFITIDMQRNSASSRAGYAVFNTDIVGTHALSFEKTRGQILLCQTEWRGFPFNIIASPKRLCTCFKTIMQNAASKLQSAYCYKFFLKY